jgi:cysteine-rich repeat protein
MPFSRRSPTLWTSVVVCSSLGCSAAAGTAVDAGVDVALEASVSLDANPDTASDASTELATEEATAPDARDDKPSEVSTFDATPADEADAATPRTSRVCGDGIRDPVLEECDDGPEPGDDTCTDDCHARESGWLARGDRDAGHGKASLGYAPHVVSANDDGFAVTYMDEGVWLQPFDEVGHRRGSPVALGQGYAPTSFANPAVAGVGGGRYAVAWTDGSTGTPDVLLQTWESGGALSTATRAHASSAGPQQDPDLLWTGSELIVAWSDLFDVRTRRFDRDLKPLGPEEGVMTMAAIESNVTLARWGDGFAAAVRANDEGLEAIGVVAGGRVWSTPPALPGPIGDRPALVELDDEHMLLVFAVGVDPTQTDDVYDSDLRAAVLDKAAPGPVDTFDWAARRPDAGAGIDQRSPSAARVGTQALVR